MSYRLPKGGRLIDRSQELTFSFNGAEMTGYAGDTLASALLANDQMLVGRSFKYHRPRGIVGSGVEEPNALMGLGAEGYFEPNQRATTQELFPGLEAASQNHWPSLENDIGAVNGYLAPFLSAGFYYKTFIHPRAAWKHLFEPFIRQSAGLGRAPTEPDADTYEHFHTHVDVLVVGAGLAGLEAALAAGEDGAEVLLVEQAAQCGGRALVDDPEAEGRVQTALERIEAAANIKLRTRCMGAGVYDHGYVLAYERLTDHLADKHGPRHRLWKIRAGKVILATGAIERPLSFAGNDVPGVMLASAMRDYVALYGIAAGKRSVVVTNNDDGYRTALALKQAGLQVPAIIDPRPFHRSAATRAAEQAGIAVRFDRAIAKVKGGKRVTGVGICPAEGTGGAIESIDCDAVAMSGGWSPVVHLWSHCGGKLIWDAAQAMFKPDPSRPPQGVPMKVVGAASGEEGPQGREEQTPLMPTWQMPANALPELKAKAFLDYQNDVKLSDVQQAAREGFESVEHAKRYTTLGMATDQGKLSNINGLAVLSDALGQPIPQTGTTTFRPPYTPVSMGAIAGEARDEIFQPLRRTPMHDWHDANGAYWEPVGHWRRPYCYQQPGESAEQAVHREVKTTREALGILDASTLGKILVKGPDAGRFLDMLYTNMMSTLKPGRCRYGLMCSENGFLSDDGVVARVDEDTFLCHTTSGGADRIHAHMEEWLQTEWWDWQVYVANVTEQYAQVGVVGPNARKLLEKLGGMDVSKQALPFMAWADGRLGDFSVRAYRISFSGELSYEIAVPAHQGLAFWEAVMQAGAEFGAQPYGTEALHIMRAEKGFIMIGDETDGTVIPQDLGLHWAISKKKDDYLGKRAQERSHMTDPDRWQLVGLKTTDGAVLPDGAYAVAEGSNANGQRNVQGRVTSTYHSPTLGFGIAMGLVKDGPARMGEVLVFPGTDGKEYRATITSPIFYDPEGEKQNV